MEANKKAKELDSKEEILNRWKLKEVFALDLPYITGIPERHILSAMTEYRSIGEREAMEQVINELVGWMEEQRLPHNYKSQVYSTLTYCITHAKSLLNQQGEEK